MNRALLTLLVLFALCSPVRAEEKILGLLELPALCAKPCPNSDFPVPLYTAPYIEESTLSISRALYIEEGSAIQDREHPLWPDTRNLEQDHAAAIVYEKIGDIAYKIKIAGQNYWIKVADIEKFHPYPQIIEGYLTYLDRWDFSLWDKPSGAKSSIGHPDAADPRDAEKIPVRVTGMRQERGHWWLQIEVLKTAPCKNAANNINLLAKGWLPAFKQDDTTSVWFDPRGC